jgi:hypothetical protein
MDAAARQDATAAHQSVRRTGRDSLALSTAIVSLITAVLGLSKACEVGRSLRTVTACSDLSVWIERPQDGQKVAQSMVAEGTASTHEACRSVHLFVRVTRPHGAEYVVTDSVQVDQAGRWKGRLDFSEVQIGQTAQVEARLTNRYGSYRPGDRIGLPPDRGVGSNLPDVERIE